MVKRRVVDPKSELEDLSIDELRWMLVEKRRAIRQDRLERYRRTGRMVKVIPDESTLYEEPLNPVEVEAIDLDEEGAGERPRASRNRRALDSFLLVIEITAVLGFIFVVFNGLSLLRELNKEVVSALKQPTLTATPLIMAVVLPSGHTPPNAAGGARPNEAEIPEHLRPLVQSLASIPLPTPGPQQAVRLQIARLNLDAPVVQGDGWEQLKKGIGQHAGTADPGQNGNVVLSAHNDIFGEYFRELDKLKTGDAIVLFTNQRSYTYLVVNSQIVEPTFVDVMKQTSESTVTLISCYPYLVDNKRIVITARLQNGG